MLTWGTIADKNTDPRHAGTFWLKAMQEEVMAMPRAVKKMHVGSKGKAAEEGTLRLKL